MSAVREYLSRYRMPLAIALWSSLLFLPFSGLKNSLILFASLTVAIPAAYLAAFGVRKFSGLMAGLKQYLPARQWLVAGLLLVCAVLPLIAQDYIVDVAILTMIYIILAEGLNVVVGFTGLLNLGFVAFYGIGAYSYALLNTAFGFGFWSALSVSVCLSAAAGFLLAVPALRLRGDYLALVTLGFGEIVRLLLNNWDSVTRGPNGISGIAPAHIFNIQLAGLTSYYYLVFVFVLCTVYVMWRVRDSGIGRAWMAIREDEIASSAMGINATLYKLYSCSFAAFWAGLAGSLFAAKMRFISPESFTFMESVLILCMVIIGGLGSIYGVLIGAVALVCLPEVLREVQMYRMLALGAGLVFLMVFRPQGLFGGRDVSS